MFELTPSVITASSARHNKYFLLWLWWRSYWNFSRHPYFNHSHRKTANPMNFNAVFFRSFVAERFKIAVQCLFNIKTQCDRSAFNENLCTFPFTNVIKQRQRPSYLNITAAKSNQISSLFFTYCNLLKSICFFCYSMSQVECRRFRLKKYSRYNFILCLIRHI